MKILSAKNDFMKLTFSIFGAVSSSVASSGVLADACADLDSAALGPCSSLSSKSACSAVAASALRFAESGSDESVTADSVVADSVVADSVVFDSVVVDSAAVVESEGVEASLFAAVSASDLSVSELASAAAFAGEESCVDSAVLPELAETSADPVVAAPVEVEAGDDAGAIAGVLESPARLVTG